MNPSYFKDMEFIDNSLKEIESTISKLDERLKSVEDSILIIMQILKEKEINENSRIRSK